MKSGNKYFDSRPPLPIPNAQGLLWRSDLEMGYLKLTETPYDAAYFAKYVEYENTDFGEKLNQARLDLVDKHAAMGASMVDIGIGSGQFMRTSGSYGFDVNRTALKILHDERLYLDPHLDEVDCATFWDSLEHIQEIADILLHVKQLAFVSIPIFESVPHVLTSKHFRPDEHCYYFTNDGFKKFMYAHGFKVIEENTIESDLGRESIGTFVCKREI